MFILDGGMGRELEVMGAPFRQPEWSALALIEAPDFVRKAHDNYIAAGADAVTVNAYACVPFHIGEERFAKDGRALIKLAGELARAAADESGRDVKVAGCIPPLFGSYEPGLFQADKAHGILLPLIEEQLPFVDFWLVETISSLEEARCVYEHLLETGKPIWLSFTLTDRDNREAEPSTIRDSESVGDVLRTISEWSGVQVVLFNCSHPEEMSEAIDTAFKTLNGRLPVGVYANSFEENHEGALANETTMHIRKDITPETYLTFAEKWKALGATIIGGCCGIGPAYIKALHEHLR